jgi:hypothetical protein
MFVSFHLLRTYGNPSLFFIFLFSPSHLQGNDDGNYDARREVSFAKFLFLPSWFVKLLEINFSRFAKIRWMPSWFAKQLELLLHE